jgi:hypothetical protein
MSKSRVPLQVSEKFAIKLRDIQKAIRRFTGEERSLRDLTEDLVNTDLFDEVEKRLIKGKINAIDINVKFDRRIFQ